MIAPHLVPAAALNRLRRRYAWLMLGLAAPVLAAVCYVLALQYQLVWVGIERQLAMSTDRRVTQLDAVLGRMREDLLRLAVTVRTPGLLMRDVEADKRALAARDDGTYTLDALPALLHDRAPQVLLTGERWRDDRDRDEAVERAAIFAEQAQIAMLRGGRFTRVTYVDGEAGAVWIFPWVSSSQWLAEQSAASVDDAIGRVAARLGFAVPVRFQDEVRWRVLDAAGETRRFALAAPAGYGVVRRFVAAEAAVAALEGARIDTGIGRFWVRDEGGQVVIDQVARGQLPSIVTDAPAMTFTAEQIDAALAAPLAREIGPAVVAMRRSAVAPWTAFYAGDRADLRSRVLRDLWPYIVGGLALMLLFAGLAVLVWRQHGRPSLRLVDFLQRQAADPRADEPDVPREWLPWTQLIRDTFAAWREAAAGEQRSEALRAAIVDHALAAVIALDANGLISEFNPAAERMFGRRRDEVVGRSPGGLIIPARVHDAAGDDLRRLRRGEPTRMIGHRVEASALRADGTEFPVELALWRTQVGGETFFTASITDLTERVAAREEIERQRDALRQAEKLAAMGSLLAGVAHELNNPLAVVMGRASLLESRCADPALRADAVRIREAADRCARIVRTFLGMARQRPAARAPVQLNDLVRGAVDLLQYNLRTSGVSVELELLNGLPAVEADADQLGQVLLNLIVNAQQALALVEPPRRLRIETGSAPGRAWLRVSDNGGGVPPADRARIFDPFVTSKSEGVGTGLGLAVSRAVAREHGGELRLEDDTPFGRGASFCLDLPLDAASPEQKSEPGSEHAPVARGGDARILVVDDEPELAAMMRDALEFAGYDVATAETGAVALAMLDEGRFDAVVTDLRMPDMDGRALWRAVRDRDPALARRFAFVTGDTLSPLAAEFRREIGVECLEKPFTAAELVERVIRVTAAR